MGFKARIMHRFLSRSDENADLTRRATEAPANVLSEYVEEADRAEHSQGGWFRRCSREFMNSPGLAQTKDVALKGAEIGKVFVVGELLENLGIGESRTGQDDGNPIVIGHLRQGLKLLVHEVFPV